jgi:hypothetical protein
VSDAVPETWMVSDDEEHWQIAEEWPTREEALAGAVEALLQYDDVREPGSTYWIGQKVPCPVNTELWGEWIVERLGEDASEEVGDPADDWPKASKAQVVDLTGRVRAAVNAWIEAHDLQPTFYAIRSVTEHEFPEPGE